MRSSGLRHGAAGTLLAALVIFALVGPALAEPEATDGEGPRRLGHHKKTGLSAGVADLAGWLERRGLMPGDDESGSLADGQPGGDAPGDEGSDPDHKWRSRPAGAAPGASAGGGSGGSDGSSGGGTAQKGHHHRHHHHWHHHHHHRHEGMHAGLRFLAVRLAVAFERHHDRHGQHDHHHGLAGVGSRLGREIRREAARIMHQAERAIQHREQAAHRGHASTGTAKLHGHSGSITVKSGARPGTRTTAATRKGTPGTAWHATHGKAGTRPAAGHPFGSHFKAGSHLTPNGGKSQSHFKPGSPTTSHGSKSHSTPSVTAPSHSHSSAGSHRR
jgi:hypothetical protein